MNRSPGGRDLRDIPVIYRHGKGGRYSVRFCRVSTLAPDPEGGQLAVYVAFEQREIDAVSEEFGLGAVLQWHGIPHGSINTNYRVETGRGRFFMRHTTVRTPSELEFEAALLAHLHESAYPAPVLLPTREGRPFWTALGGRVSVFQWLAGDELSRGDLDPGHARRVGYELAKLHRVSNSFAGERPNPYG